MDPSIAIDVLSDDDDDSHLQSFTKLEPPTIFVIDDDPTPQKPNSKNPNRATPSFVAETPLSDDVSIVKCSISSDQRVSDKLTAGISGFICLESDSESEDAFHGSYITRPVCDLASFEQVGCSGKKSTFAGESEDEDLHKLNSPIKPAAASDGENNKNSALNMTFEHSNGWSVGSLRNLEDPFDDSMDAEPLPQVSLNNYEEFNMPTEVENAGKRKGKNPSSKNNRYNQMNDVAARKKQEKEEKARIDEEKKRKRQEEKLEKEALKAEKAEKRKLEKEAQNWEKGKFAVKSIVAEIDARIVENGSIGGHLLTRFAEKGLTYRITSNPVERSILWQMRMPDQIAQVSSVASASAVPYVLIVYQAEEFCELVRNKSLTDQICSIQSRYPSFTICCLTNKLMSYINKCEQNHYKNPSKVGSWKRPPVEEALATLSTHFTKVHSRQCFDEAELADHIVGLTSSLANCQFRKKLTYLSVNANGSVVSKDFIDKNVIKKNVWLKALVSIPKVQPRHAMAIWKRYPTMRSLLNVYMDPNISVHEKEFLLEDLKIEGVLGNEDRRLGEVCSKRIYRILMAQSGGIMTDEVEDGADLFVR